MSYKRNKLKCIKAKTKKLLYDYSSIMELQVSAHVFSLPYAVGLHAPANCSIIY